MGRRSSDKAMEEKFSPLDHMMSGARIGCCHPGSSAKLVSMPGSLSNMIGPRLRVALSASNERIHGAAMRRGLAISALAAGILAAVFVAACSPFGSSNKITLGAVVPVTGPLANSGRYYRDAYQ